MKTSTQKITKNYELTYLMPGDLTDAELSQVRKEVEDLIKKYQGEVAEQEDWGRKLLAYKIKQAGKKHVEAVFVHLIIQLDPSKVKELKKDINLNKRVVRHLLVSCKKEVINKAVKAE